MAQKPPVRRRSDEGGVGHGVAPAVIGLESVLALGLGLTLMIVALIIADIVHA
jgi:hypothetical protein